MERAIYKLEWDFGRMGDLSGVFVANKADVKRLITNKTEIYFGEVLGKHSEVYGCIEKKHLKLVTDNEEFIELFIKYDLSNGYNPFDYLDEDGMDEEDGK